MGGREVAVERVVVVVDMMCLVGGTTSTSSNKQAEVGAATCLIEASAWAVLDQLLCTCAVEE